MIKFEYDAAHQLKYKYLPGETVSYGYDSGGNLTSVQDSDSKLSFTYDRLNLLTRAQTLSGYLQPGTTQTYTYDKSNNQATWVDVQNTTFKYYYDNLNRLTDIKNSAGTTTFAHYVYDALSRRANLTYPNLTSATYAYDLASHLTSLKNLLPNLTPFSSFDYIYNKAGFREMMTTLVGPHQFTYDDIYRLTGADHPDSADESFTYDGVGNRVGTGAVVAGFSLRNKRSLKAAATKSATTDSADATWLYNDANQLLDDGIYTYTYDDNGNMATKTEKANPARVIRYTYSSENQLTQISAPGAGTVKYAYDGLGRRIQKDINGVKTKYVYDNEDIVAEYNGSNVLQATYLHGPGIDEPVYMERGGQKYYYHADGLGSITELTNSTGAVVQTYEYDSFGNIILGLVTRDSGLAGDGPRVTSDGITNPFTYTGREFDSESGLFYYRARYYDPRIGRFLQEDPMGFIGGDIVLYGYTKNNPINFTDPWGLQECYLVVTPDGSLGCDDLGCKAEGGYCALFNESCLCFQHPEPPRWPNPNPSGSPNLPRCPLSPPLLPTIPKPNLIY